MSSARIRVTGILSQAQRGLVLTTESAEVWVIEAESVRDASLGSRVTVEGVIAGLDRIRADWIGYSNATE